jgi:hypothetical protein
LASPYVASIPRPKKQHDPWRTGSWRYGYGLPAPTIAQFGVPAGQPRRGPVQWTKNSQDERHWPYLYRYKPLNVCGIFLELRPLSHRNYLQECSHESYPDIPTRTSLGRRCDSHCVFGALASYRALLRSSAPGSKQCPRSLASPLIVALRRFRSAGEPSYNRDSWCFWLS